MECRWRICFAASSSTGLNTHCRFANQITWAHLVLREVGTLGIATEELAKGTFLSAFLAPALATVAGEGGVTVGMAGSAEVLPLATAAR